MRSERVLVWLKPKYLGDAVMATPLLGVLQNEFANPTVLAAPHIQEMFKEDRGSLDLIPPYNLKELSGLRQEVKRLRSMRFDIALIVNRSFRSALAAWLAGIRIRVGHATEGRSLLLNRRVKWDWYRSEAESYGDLARAVGVEGDYRRVHLTCSPEEREDGQRMLQGATIAVQPGASFVEKALPTAGLAEIIDRFHKEGRKVALLGGKEEAPLAEELKAATPHEVVDLLGATSIRQLIGVSANLDGMIGGSTGIMHISTAVGCPTVSVFGPNHSSKWGHFYPPHQVVQIPSTVMADMDADQVFAAAQRALQAGLELKVRR